MKTVDTTKISNVVIPQYILGETSSTWIAMEPTFRKKRNTSNAF